jgi:hypothetical protein
MDHQRGPHPLQLGVVTALGGQSRGSGFDDHPQFVELAKEILAGRRGEEPGQDLGVQQAPARARTVTRVPVLGRLSTSPLAARMRMASR